MGKLVPYIADVPPQLGNDKLYLAGQLKKIQDAISSLIIALQAVGGTSGSVPFFGSGGALAQDNANFFWDDSNLILKAGTQIQLLLNGAFVPALFPIYNAGGNNWFAAHAGNTSATGNLSLGFGDGALQRFTSGSGLLALGNNAMNFATTDTNSVALGNYALYQVNGGYSNFGLGVSVFQNLHNGGGNTGVGVGAGATQTGGSSNTYVGNNSGSSITGTSNNNTLLGTWSGPSGSISGVIGISDGGAVLRQDYNYTTANVWTFAAAVSIGTYTVATLPTSPAGTMAYVTDGTAALAWGATVTGGSTTKYLVWFNGTNWTVVGK
jgi:hypothetical protein